MGPSGGDVLTGFVHMRLAPLAGFFMAVAASLGADDPAPQETRCVKVGVLKGAHVAIGAETTGWTIDGLDVEAVKVDLKSHDGSRVAIFGMLSERAWKERGKQPILHAQRIARVRREEFDLVVKGKVVLLEAQKMERARVGVQVHLHQDRSGEVPGGEITSTNPAADGTYEVRIPAIADEFAGWRYHFFVQVDQDDDGRFSDLETHPRVLTDDIHDPDTLYVMNDEWRFGGGPSGEPMTVRSPCAHDLRVER